MTQTLRHFISNIFRGVTRCSLLVTRSRSCSLQKITRYWLQRLLVVKNYSLLVAKLARSSLQKKLIARNHSLLVAKFARYSLQKLQVPKHLSLLVAKITLYSLQKLLVAKNHSLLVAVVASSKKSLVTRCKICLLLDAEIYEEVLWLYWKVTPAEVLSCKFLQNFKNIYSVEHLQTSASENNI